MLSPAEIESVQFKVVRLKEGYSQDEVDDFLDRVVVSYRQVYAELEGYRKAETQVMPVIPEVSSEVVQASKLLKVAEEACRQEREEAMSKAAQTIQEAQDKATSIVDEATRQKHLVIGEMEERRDRLTARLNELSHVHAEVLRKIKNAMKALEE